MLVKGIQVEVFQLFFVIKWSLSLFLSAPPPHAHLISIFMVHINYCLIFFLVTICLFQEDIIDFHDFVPKFFVFQSGRTIKFGGQCLPNLGFRIPPCQLTVQVTYGAQAIIIFPKTFSDLWNNHSWIQQLEFRGRHVFVSFLKKGKVWLGQNRGLAIV